MRNLWIALVFTALPSHAAIYKCTIDGVLTYSDQPCSEQSVEIKVEERNALKKASYTSNQTLNTQKTNISDYIEHESLDRKIAKQKNKIKSIERKRDKEIHRLKQSSTQAYSDQKKVIYEPLIIQKVSMVRYDANIKLRAAQDKLNQLVRDKKKLSRKSSN